MKIINGNDACASMSYKLSDISFIYPITPSSPMASKMDLLSNKNFKNIFDDNVKVIEMQSEAGAAGAMHGALISGSLASTFTSSQGLLLMIPNMYKIAGEMLPAVIHVASRSIATQALSIFGDHQDIYATKQTGFSILASTNVQDAYNLALVSHLSAIDSSLPFIHFFDGFRTSHETNVITELKDEDIKSLVNFEKITEFRKRGINSGKSITKGTAQNEDVYFQMMEAKNTFYEKVSDIVNANMKKVNKLAGEDYKPFNYYGSENAKHIIIAMGSVCDTVKSVLQTINKFDDIYGLIEVHLYRPFSKKYLLNALPKTVKNIAVLDRTKEHGSAGEPLYLDVLSSLKDKKIKIYGGRYGLSSKNTTPNDIYDVFMSLKNSPKNNFTIGIIDDITNTNLKRYDYCCLKNFKEIKIYGFGSDGMVSASKEILNILGKDKYVQGYSEYDSKKSGGVTINHLRFSDTLIKEPYYTTNPELIVITKDQYFYKFDMISNINDNGIVLINANRTEDELNRFLPTKVKETLHNKKIKVYTIDAEKISNKNNIRGKISTVMETAILKLLEYPNYKEILTNLINNRFKEKGNQIVEANINCIDESQNSIKEIKINQEKTLDIKTSDSPFDIINAREGYDLTVGDLIEYTDGHLPGGTSALERRKMSQFIAKWNNKDCIQCGMCALMCPHAVIRQFLVDHGSKFSKEGIKALEQNKDFIIAISEVDCTSCGICAKVCPKNCFSFGEYDQSKQDMADELFNKEYPHQEIKTIRDSQFNKPLFEFSGACAGCGETPYIKLLTQIVGEKLVIANATGCSSIYGASCPSTPYKVSWANSLFEDNAEFSLGILESYNKMQNRIEKLLLKNKDAETFYNKWKQNKTNYEETKKLEKEATKYLPEDLIEYLTPKSVWAIGGDGWAYDIGFGGIDHILSSGENIKILVLDTETYSNTGGQASKATKIGAVAQFANMGKKTIKKDLFKIAMTYPNTYVASVSIGANMMQTINAVKEAEEHNGPAIIIAYSPCIEHGIKGGLVNGIENQRLAVQSGYNLLMRYNNEELKIDSPEPNFDKYMDFLDTERRFSSLKIKDDKIANELLLLNKENAIKRYNYYKNLANK